MGLIDWRAAVRRMAPLPVGANPNAPDPRGWTALHQAVSRRNVRIIADLVAAYADPTVQDCEDRSPIDLADGARDLLRVLRK